MHQVNNYINSFSTARAVIIDLQPPMDAGTCLNIKDALDNVLTMLTHLMGPCRVPLFSLSVLRSYTEVYHILIHHAIYHQAHI